MCPVESEHHVVERCPNVGDEVTEQDGKVGREWSEFMERVDLCAAIGLQLTGNGIRLVPTPVRKPVKVLDMVVCPRDFLLDRFDLPSKVTGGHGR